MVFDAFEYKFKILLWCPALFCSYRPLLYTCTWNQLRPLTLKIKLYISISNYLQWRVSACPENRPFLSITTSDSLSVHLLSVTNTLALNVSSPLHGDKQPLPLVFRQPRLSHGPDMRYNLYIVTCLSQDASFTRPKRARKKFTGILLSWQIQIRVAEGRRRGGTLQGNPILME